MIETLHSLRFIFFMMIFMSHFSYAGVEGFEAGGKCGVSFFFMLSGYIMAHVYGAAIGSGRFDSTAFMRRRILKIFPVHFLCLLVFFVFNVRHLDGLGYMRLLSNMLLLQSWIPLQDFYFSGNAESWFLSSVMFCYVAFQLLFRILSRGSVRRVCLVLSALVASYLAYVCVLPDGQSVPFVYINPAVRAVDFSIGIILWRIAGTGIAGRAGYGRSVAGDTAMELLVVAACAASLTAYPYVGEKFALASLFWPADAAVILLFSSDGSKGLLSALLRRRFMIYLGGVAFLMFMVHTIAINITQAVAERLSGMVLPSGELDYMVMLCLCLAATWCGAQIAGRAAALLGDRIRTLFTL